MTKDCVCVLDPNAPTLILEMLAGYIGKVGNLHFVLCASIDYGAFFVELGLVKRKQDNPWLVAIPHQYILAIADRGEDAPIGFRSE